jgi:tripartite-type tricarboxylate transporter receptor subunit TctC
VWVVSGGEVAVGGGFQLDQYWRVSASNRYDIARDLAPIVLLAKGPFVLMSTPGLPVASLKELIAYAKSRPGKLSIASSGNGTSVHLSAELLRSLASIEVLHVPYKGSAPAMQDLIGGHTQMVFDNLPFVLPFVKAGKVRALAVTTTARNPQLPEVPTMIEAGVPGYDVTSWFGLAAPGGLAAPLVDRWYQESVKALQHPDTRQRFGDLGASIVGSTPVEFGAFIRSELAKWARVVKASGVKAD